MSIPLQRRPTQAHLRMHTRLVAIIALLASCSLVHAYEGRAPAAVELSGRWALNAALSDDADALLLRRLEKQLQRERRWREEDAREEGRSEEALVAEEISRPQAGRALARLREALGLYPMLEIRQGESGASLEISTAASNRRFTAGSRSQVSMPEGQLADSEAGWEGEWFVIERKVRKGPRVIERYRLLKKTDQLQVRVAWSGGDRDELLSGIKLQLVFDRASTAARPIDPDRGPVR